MFTLYSWNVNGIRSAAQQGFEAWFRGADPDVVCVQEIKARPEQVDDATRAPAGYHASWHPAERPGYSGVATFSREAPRSVEVGLGRKDVDREGRVLISEFPGLYVVNAYFPNSQRDHARLPYKLSFCRSMLRKLNALKQRKPVLLCGDLNIAHREIDLANPKANRKNAGFLPEERAWLDRLEARHGYVDTFRHLCAEPGHYSWWSQRIGVRERNIGWRLDMVWISACLAPALRAAAIHPEVRGSDHCPVSASFEL
ncbi:MAG: exodeoxyribonuclease III [Planctomycetota bacterium]